MTAKGNLMRHSIALAAALLLSGELQARPGRLQEPSLAEADRDGDGSVTRSEFAQHRAERFTRMDRNGDGVLSADDLGRLARFRRDAAGRFRDFIRQADRNGDGRLTQDELREAPTPVFDRLDANGNGRLEAGEIRRPERQRQ
jgi:Ca2+-binding EF-hand superfamily protein